MKCPKGPGSLNPGAEVDPVCPSLDTGNAWEEPTGSRLRRVLPTRFSSTAAPGILGRGRGQCTIGLTASYSAPNPLSSFQAFSAQVTGLYIRPSNPLHSLTKIAMLLLGAGEGEQQHILLSWPSGKSSPT